MIKIINLLERIDFVPEENGKYVGNGTRCGDITFEFKNHFLICTRGDAILFSIIYE